MHGTYVHAYSVWGSLGPKWTSQGFGGLFWDRMVEHKCGKVGISGGRFLDNQWVFFLFV